MAEKEISSSPSRIMKVQDIPSRVKGIVVLSHFLIDPLFTWSQIQIL